MIKLGQKAHISRSFSEQDVIDFSKLSKDENPIHFDEDYAKKTRFGKRIVQGKLISSLFSGVLGSKLPGNGTIYLSQTINFLKPVYLDENVTAFVEVIKIREDKNIFTLRTWVVNSTNETVVDGEAVVLFIP